MMGELRYDGQVAVVTGAGAGLGRAYALLFASRGAKVVVNDLGGGRHGEGKSNAADNVVEEIKKNGGTAVADYNSVVEGEKIIETAMKSYGRVDILVNNAGILRDKSFARISDQDWDLIHAVHVKGSFKTTQAAWPVFKKQNYGRIIMTASNSGVYGNFGQANYSAAKLGLVGLANTLAIEGKKNNIHCNVIVPTAASRLTEDILPPDLFQELRPELIAPVVAFMCHESCEDTGIIIDSAVGWAAKVHMVRGPGTHLRKSVADNVTLENVRDNWSKVVDMSQAQRINSLQEATGEIMSSLQALKDGANETGGSSLGIAVDEILMTPRDFVIYALGIGASVENQLDMKFLYENDADFISFPTYFINPGLTQLMVSNIVAKSLPPGVEANFSNILHGEQYIEIVGDLPQGECVLTSRSSVIDVLDKGSGIVAIVENELFDKNGNMVVKTQISSFVVGVGGYGGPRKSTKAIESVPAPSRAADAVMEQKTSVDQAALYRLSGDINPLHIDPQMAILSGFKKPILHGLCSLGFSTRHVLKHYANNDPRQMKCLKARFVKPVYPGETLVTSMWLNGQRVHFETSVKERNVTVISGAYIDLKSAPVMTAGSAALKSDGVFERIIDGVKQQPDKAKTVNGVFLYNIMSDGKQVKQWTLDLKTPSVYEGSPKSGKADTTLVISDDDMVDIATGKLNPQVAFMKGKLKITGNIMLTQKLAPLLQAAPKM